MMMSSLPRPACVAPGARPAPAGGGRRIAARRGLAPATRCASLDHGTTSSSSSDSIAGADAQGAGPSAAPRRRHRFADRLAPLAGAALLAAAAGPAAAADDLPSTAPSYYVSLGLFVMSVPGLWSLIKRAPKAKVKRRTFEVPGPAAPGALPLDERARQLFAYFKRYNYSVAGTGEVITFEGRYKPSVSQAAALVLYSAVSLASCALVLSVAAPWGGSAWYALCALSPAAGAYYLSAADRVETVRVKMVTADDDAATDIVVEGDEEELERLRRELELPEKGKVYVKGLLEK